MKDFIVILILAVVIGLAIRYIVKAKKNGIKCIGCPSAHLCNSKNKENCNCNK